jgi:hypothetical protein
LWKSWSRLPARGWPPSHWSRAGVSRQPGGPLPRRLFRSETHYRRGATAVQRAGDNSRRASSVRSLPGLRTGMAPTAGDAQHRDWVRRGAATPSNLSPDSVPSRSNRGAAKQPRRSRDRRLSAPPGRGRRTREADRSSSSWLRLAPLPESDVSRNLLPRASECSFRPLFEGRFGGGL